VIRFWNHQLDEDYHAVVDAIAHALSEAGPTVAPPPLPSPPRRGEGAGT
jgi:hypothetical protein